MHGGFRCRVGVRERGIDMREKVTGQAHSNLDTLLLVNSLKRTLDDPTDVQRQSVRRLCASKVSAVRTEAITKCANPPFEHLGDQRLVESSVGAGHGQSMPGSPSRTMLESRARERIALSALSMPADRPQPTVRQPGADHHAQRSGGRCPFARRFAVGEVAGRRGGGRVHDLEGCDPLVEVRDLPGQRQHPADARASATLVRRSMMPRRTLPALTPR